MVYSIQELLYIWESYGLFDTLFPFLLVFSFVFGILTAIGLFGNRKGINIIISFVIGLMAVREQFMTRFYEELFPKLGIGLTLLLALLILIGLFIKKSEQKYWFWGFGAIAVIIGIIIIFQTFERLGWMYGLWFGSDTVAWIILGVLFLGIIIAVASASSGKEGIGKRLADEFGQLFSHPG